MIASVVPMGVDRLLASARRLIGQPSWSPFPVTPRSIEPHSIDAIDGPDLVDLETATRRRTERSHFGDDAQYFEFIIERAIERGSATS